MQESEDGHAGSPAIEPSPRRSVEMSIESVSINDDRETPNVSPATTTASGRGPSMGNRLDFELARSERNKRYNALSDISALSEVPEHEDPPNSPNDMPAALRPALTIVTRNLKNKSNTDLSLANFDEAFASSQVAQQRHPRNYEIGMSSDSIEGELKDAIAEHYVFQTAMAGVPLEDAYNKISPAASSTKPFHGSADQEPASDGLALSPSSSIFWQDLEHGPFDTPPGASRTVSPKSQHRAIAPQSWGLNEEDPQHYEFRSEPEHKSMQLSAAEDSLDECLDLFQNYNASQAILSSDPMEECSNSENPFDSPKAQNRSRSSSEYPATPRKTPPSKRPPPARYRSKRNRV